jgi:hypothetical protein
VAHYCYTNVLSLRTGNIGHTSLLYFVSAPYYCVLFSDINKFLWMVRIGGSTERGSHIKEWDYYSPSGEFRVDKEGSPTLLNCLMYKMCYYRFGQVYTEGGELLIYSCVVLQIK